MAVFPRPHSDYQRIGAATVAQLIHADWYKCPVHTDTLLTGCDPEIATPLPTDILGTLPHVFATKNGPRELLAVRGNAVGHIGADEKTFVPEME